MIKLILDIIKPESRVNAQELKDKLRKLHVNKCNGNARAMLTKIEPICNQILSEKSNCK